MSRVSRAHPFLLSVHDVDARGLEGLQALSDICSAFYSSNNEQRATNYGLGLKQGLKGYPSFR